MKRLGVMIGILSLPALWVGPRLASAQDGDGWGTIKGRIIWGDKEIPKRNPIDLIKQSGDKDHCLAKGDILEENWVVHPKNKGLRGTFVWLAPAAKGKPLPIHPDLKKIPGDAVMDQPLCMFTPQALGMREGQVLIVKNSATIGHSFKWPGGNIVIPPGGERAFKDFKAERLPVTVECALHPWMRGWIGVFDHPYFAVTDENGAFEMKNAPAGEFRLMVWHGSGGWLGGASGRTGRPVAIEAGKTRDLGALEYPPPKN